MDLTTVPTDPGHRHLLEIGEKFKAERYVFDVFGLVLKAFGDDVPFRIIRNIANNQLLFYLYARSKCERAYTLDRALEYAGTNPKRILIHFSEIGVYGVYTVEEYAQFLSHLRDKVDVEMEEKPRVNFHPQEIVFTGLPQKLVFVCFGSDVIIEKIRGYVREKYNCDITCTKTDDTTTEISIQSRGGNNYEETQKTYYELTEYIANEKHDREVAQKMYPMRVEKLHGHEYITANISGDPMQYNGAADVIKALASIPTGTVVNLVIVYGDNNNVVAGNNNNNNNNQPAPVVDNRALTRDWIRANAPAPRENSPDYYARYTDQFAATAIKNCEFGKLLALEGYKIKKSNGLRFYEK